ncbi:phosphatase PAP2 family protein [Mitsuaria sp. GD03876]|uniref:phosphatase PAP2 family protein n=1 Tax=Mitsuaria sp. GD03876 TaxID=2975399 RepID=UPI00244AB140|nr:phosphatase PAP2 family protein [Mitsuaria sp. GD03876]MDH0867089.1 phosphatase PAP2 family protein [Mitsuaria sp. GD03876]
MLNVSALEAASYAGAHALAIYAALLLLLLAITWATARVLLPDRGDRTVALEPLSPVALVLRFAIGFAFIVGGAMLFAEIAEAVHVEHTLGQLDEAFIVAMIDRVPDAALHAFYLLTFLGNRETQIAIGVLGAIGLLALRRRGLALGWSLALLGNAALNPLLKHVFERARPVHPTHWLTEDGFSFPSGHSSGTVMTMGMLAFLAVRLLPRRWHVPAWIAAAALAFSVGASRVFLRVHFPSDVLAGFASGSAWLTVSIVSIELARWARRRRGARQASAVELTR